MKTILRFNGVSSGRRFPTGAYGLHILLARMFALALLLGTSLFQAYPQAVAGTIVTDYENTWIASGPVPDTGWSPGVSVFSGSAGPAGDPSTANDGTYWLVQAADGQPLASGLAGRSPMVVAELGEIPALIAVQGRISSFTVRATRIGPGATFSLIVNPDTPSPQGAINLDADTGVFTYIPDPSDLRPFSVTIVASKNGMEQDRQIVDITPLPVLPAEESVIASGHGFPNPESIHYIVSNVATNQPIVFNDVPRKTLDIIVGGKTIPIRNGHDDGLALLDGNQNISTLKIYAETVLIETTLNLPGTDVEIHAQTVQYKNNATIASAGLLISTNGTDWITPSVCRMMLDYAKDVYLYGHYPEAGNLFVNVESVVDLALSAPPESNEAIEYEQIRGEASTQLFKLATLQDYFGFPVGYVPSLSLELVTSLYNAEIGSNLESLYLAYKIRTAETNIQNRIQAAQNAKNDLKADVTKNKQALADTQSQLKLLQDQSAQLNSQLAGLQQELRDRQQNAQNQRKKNRWLSVVNTVALVAQAIPNPYFQAAGAFLQEGVGIADQLLKAGPVGYLPGVDKVLSVVAYGNQVIQTFNNSNFSAGIGEFETCVGGFDSGELISSIRNCASNIKTGIDDVKKAWESSRVSIEPLLKQYADAKAQSPDLNAGGLLDRMQATTLQIQQVGFQIATNVAYIGALKDTIYKSLLGIDSLNIAVRESNSKLDHTALSYVKSMEHRAVERLRFYHYLVGKSYEYRLLQPYSGDLKIEDLIPRLDELVRSGAAPDGKLSSDPTAELNLRGVYEDILSGITQTIVNQALGGQRLQTTVDYPLSDDEVNSLNLGQPVSINLEDRGKLDGVGEDYRIVDVKIAGTGASIEDTSHDLNTSLVVELTSSSFGKFRHDTNVVAFGNVAPLKRLSRYQASSAELGLVQDQASTTQDTLLRSLLRLRNLDLDQNTALFIQIPAWTALTLNETVTPTSSSGSARLKQLTLRFVLDYLPTRQTVPLHIIPSSDQIMPTLIVDTPDLSGRTHSFGELYRIYPLNSKVQVQAPAIYGSWLFSHWRPILGGVLSGEDSTNPVVKFDLGTEGRLIEAVYVQGTNSGHRLTRTINPPQGGSIVATPGPGIDGTYSDGALVSLDAVPADGFQFASWLGDVSNTGNPLLLVMSNDWAVTASFTPRDGAAPSIISQPQSVTVPPGRSAVFGLMASGTEPLAYQWKFNEVIIAGANSNILIVPNVSGMDVGNYRAVVSNPLGSVTSITASLILANSSGPSLVSVFAPIFTNLVPFAVGIHAIPPAGTTVYVVEDQPPPGWSVSMIGQQGTLRSGKVTWIFGDDLSRTLTYVITPPIDAIGTNHFVGQASFDGVTTSPITGARDSTAATGVARVEAALVWLLDEPFVRITVAGNVGDKYQIQRTQGLERGHQWVGKASLSLDSSVKVWLDPEPLSGSGRFYQAVRLP